MHDKLIANLCVLLGYRIVFDASPHMGYRQHGRNVVGVSTDLPSKVIEKINSFCHPREITLAKQVTDFFQLIPTAFFLQSVLLESWYRKWTLLSWLGAGFLSLRG
ncbi:MAG: hypothetical protein ACLU1W_03600 [Collinsella sp.]